MLGVALSLAAAAFFGVNMVVARQGVRLASANYIANLSVFVGPLFFLLIAVVTGEIYNLSRFSPEVYIYFALSGVVHFALGRTFGYRSLQLIGATRANLVTSMAGVVTIVEALVLLGETLTPVMALGIIISMFGPVLLATKERTVGYRVQPAGQAGAGVLALGKDVDRRTLYLGLLFASGCALCWGTSPIFIKLAFENGGTSIAGSLIAYCAASLAVSYTLLDRGIRTELLTWNPDSFRLAMNAGMTTNIAQLLRFIALAHAPAVVVSQMQRTSPVWVLMIAFIFERRTESFSRWVLIGNLLLVVGTVMVAM